VDEDYEQVHAYLGNQAFARLVKAYIAAHPSDQRNARWFSRHLRVFIAKFEAYAKHPEVPELAALEKALADAFDGPDCNTLTIDALARLPPEAWPYLVFHPNPTVIRLSFATNPAAIWSALKNETAPPKPTPLPEQQAIIVWRQELMARF